MKDLRVKAIVLSLIVLGTAQALGVVFSLWQEQSRQTQAGAEQIELAARVVGESYVTRATQNRLLAARLAADPALRLQAYRGSIQDLEALLRRRAPLSAHEFVAITDAGGALLFLTTGAEVRLPQPALEAALAAHDTDRLLPLSGQTVAVARESFTQRESTFGLITGFSPVPVIKTRLAASMDGQVQIVETDNGRPVISLPLDAEGNISLTANLQLADQSNSTLYLFILGQFGAALFILSMAALACALLYSRLFTKHIDRPISSLRRSIRSLKDGRLQEPVRAIEQAPFHNVASDLEAMREAVSERENKVMHHAEYDSLTGLTNRSVVSEKIKTAMTRAHRNGTVVAAMAIDLSRFSEINGSMGHEVGDEVLKEIARRLASNARVTDTVARVGGDEFFVVLEDDDVKLAQSLARFMLSSLTTPIHVSDAEFKLNVHAGLAFYPMHCDSADSLRRMANIGLYTAKEQDDSLVIYEPGQDEKHLRELAIIHDLPNAIKNRELYLQYQPKIDMDNQQVRQVEALVRWRHPQLGFIPPDEFIALLEKSGMIGKLTEWVFKEAVLQARAWMEAGHDIGIAVNISANDLLNEALPGQIKKLLHYHAVDANRITIEVTESAVIKNPDTSVKLLNELRSSGIRCSLDDFGTGQTSLALLKQLPISEIKIDKSFVQNLRADSGDAIIVKSIIDLGHNMGLHVTAEGVESNYCWNLLNSYGCNLVQGYLVSAPLTADELAEWHLRLQDRHMNKLDLSFVHNMTA
ncbi:MAG: EAL domain-containing protein [Pseudomonadota bacterium]